MKITALVLVAGLATAAHAGTLLGSFSYENLDTDYDAMTGQLVTATDGLLSTGSVTRLVPASGSADFGVPTASMTLDLTVSNISGSNADGNGTLLITDTTGDTITANVDGLFTFVPIVGSTGVIFFDGVLSNLFFNDISGDGLFDGDSGSFSTDFTGFGNQPYFGAIQRLQVTDVNFFQTGWGNKIAEVDGQIVPAPGALALIGLSALAAGRRRR